MSTSKFYICKLESKDKYEMEVRSDVLVSYRGQFLVVDKIR